MDVTANNAQFNRRLQLYEDTIACKPTGQITVAPMVMYLPINLYGQTTIQATMESWENAFPSFFRYHEEFQPDLAWGPQPIFPSRPLEILDCKYVQWPGKHFDGANRGFQVLDDEYMTPDEYLEYAEDPTGFTLRKVLPRHYSALEPLQELDLTNILYISGLFGMIPFGLPHVQGALAKLGEAGQVMLETAKLDGEYCAQMAQRGWPMALDLCGMAPFDIFNDTLRGLLNTTMDMIEYPDELLKALEASTRIQVRYIKKQMAMRPVKSVVFFIHNGMDMFMSLEQYKTFYWPGLKACIEAIIEMGGTPHLYLEDNYASKLDLFAAELPPGKCIITFIGTDMEKVKDKLAGRVCVTGGVSGTLLQYGSKDEVVADVKNAIDVCAPGGGYILNCDVSLDVAKPENLHAMFDTARSYVKT